MTDTTPEEVAEDFERLAEENLNQGHPRAAEAYDDAANYVRIHLVEEDND